MNQEESYNEWIKGKETEIKKHRASIRVLKEEIAGHKKDLLRLQYPGLSESIYRALGKPQDYERLKPKQMEFEIKRLSGEEVDRDLLRKVLACVKEHGILCAEDIHYKTKPCAITAKEFSELYRQLEAMIGDRMVEKDGSFSECEAYFEYEGFKFIWNLVVGQGSIATLVAHDHNDKAWAFNEDLKIEIPS